MSSSPPCMSCCLASSRIASTLKCSSRMLFCSSPIRRSELVHPLPQRRHLLEDPFLQRRVAGVLELLDERGQLPLLPGQLAGQLAELLHPLLVEERLEVERVLLQRGDLLLDHPGQPGVDVVLAAAGGRGGTRACGTPRWPSPGPHVLARRAPAPRPAPRSGRARGPALRPVATKSLPSVRPEVSTGSWAFTLSATLGPVAVRPLHPGGEVPQQPFPQLGRAPQRLPPVLGGAVDHQRLLPAGALLRTVHRVVVGGLDGVADAVPGGELERGRAPT